jgi:uncharacterized protein YlaN (UPF0358 family)
MVDVIKLNPNPNPNPNPRVLLSKMAKEESEFARERDRKDKAITALSKETQRGLDLLENIKKIQLDNISLSKSLFEEENKGQILIIESEKIQSANRYQTRLTLLMKEETETLVRRLEVRVRVRVRIRVRVRL